MKNKAFTLIELLAVITIIAILSAIGVISYQKIITSSRMKSYTSYEKTMNDSAVKQIDKMGIPKIMEYKYLSLKDLVKENYLEAIKDPFANNSQESCLNDSYELVIRCDNPKSEYNTSGYNMLYIDCLKCNSGYQTEFKYKNTSLNIGKNNTGNNVCTLTKDKIEANQINTLCNNKMIIDGDTLPTPTPTPNPNPDTIINNDYYEIKDITCEGQSDCNKCFQPTIEKSRQNPCSKLNFKLKVNKGIGQTAQHTRYTAIDFSYYHDIFNKSSSLRYNVATEEDTINDIIDSFETVGGGLNGSLVQYSYPTSNVRGTSYFGFGKISSGNKVQGTKLFYFTIERPQDLLYYCGKYQSKYPNQANLQTYLDRRCNTSSPNYIGDAPCSDPDLKKC